MAHAPQRPNTVPYRPRGLLHVFRMHLLSRLYCAAYKNYCCFAEMYLFVGTWICSLAKMSMKNICISKAGEIILLHDFVHFE